MVLREGFAERNEGEGKVEDAKVIAENTAILIRDLIYMIKSPFAYIENKTVVQNSSL